jgi:anti-sigma factor RsiW
VVGIGSGVGAGVGSSIGMGLGRVTVGWEQEGQLVTASSSGQLVKEWRSSIVIMKQEGRRLLGSQSIGAGVKAGAIDVLASVGVSSGVGVA